MRQVGFASRDLTRRLGRKPSSGEIAAQLGMPVDSVERAMSVVREPSPLEHPPGDPTGLDLSKTIPDDSAPSPYEEAVKRQLGRRLDSILARLNPREEEIVRLRFGIGHDDTRTLEQIGRKLRITRERVRQIESIALSKLKRSVQSRELAGLYGISA